MLTNNSVAYSGKIFIEIIIDIVYFPVWWYTRGAYLFAKKLFNFLGNKQKSLALWVWIKNLYRPMFGQYDWQGMLISFFMRLVQIIFRSIVMFFWVIFIFVCFCIWLILPLFVLYEIIFQLHG
jgi:hypothetical protein